MTILTSPELASDRSVDVLLDEVTPLDRDAVAVVATASADAAGVGRYTPGDLGWRRPVKRSLRHPVKRSLDVVLATALLVAASPVLLAAVLAVKATSRGPALFRQTRVGRDGRLFTMLKVRTMVADAEQQRDALLHLNEADGPLFKIAADPRVTRVGRVLRKLSIDELPQLVNVIRGDMSLVGPRPALPSEVDAWHPELHGRLQVRPGITGLWQVSGRSDCTFDDYARYDLEYVATWTIATDLAILARTVPYVLSARGAR